MLAESSGVSVPRTSRLDPEAGNKLARFAGARQYIRMKTPDMIDKVLGKNASPEDRLYFGALLTEWQLRYTKKHFQDTMVQSRQQAAAALRAGDQAAALEANERADQYQKLADAVGSIIGEPGHPIKDFATYARGIKSKEAQAVLGRWKENMVPDMEDNYRKAMGMEDDDPIVSSTQVPGYPMNLKAVRDPSQISPTTVGTGKGNLKNLRTGKFGFAEGRTGAALAYDVDLGNIIENSLSHGYSRAAKNDMLRTMIDKDVIRLGPPGKPPVFDEGAGKELDWVKPPRDIATDNPGQVLYANPEAYDEIRKAYDTDKEARIPFVTPLLNTATRANLLGSLKEAAFHTANYATALLKPYTLVPLLKRTFQMMRGDPAIGDDLIELAKIAAAKEHGFQGPQLMPEWRMNPLTWPNIWLRKFVDTADKVVRLALADAYDKIAAAGHTTWSEEGKRDFVNAGAGQYNRKMQSDVVRLLRSTGIGPYATASTHWWIEGMKKVLLFGTNTGIKANSWSSDVYLRARMLAKLAGLLGLGAATNMVLWGRADGDDQTPLLAVKTGEKGGRTSYVDLGQLTGVNRGLRGLGLYQPLEDWVHGKQTPDLAKRSLSDVFHGALHPAVGPGVGAIYTWRTGLNTIGQRVAPEVSKATTPKGIIAASRAGKPMPGSSQDWENAKAALWGLNPTIADLSGHNRPGKDPPVDERLWGLLGPWGLRFRGEVGQPGKKKRP
jgi:hypothetical protein